MDLFKFDSNLRKAHGSHLCGVDEAGRGCWVGSIWASAVVFEEGVVIEHINDSKKLSDTQREDLYDEILEKALSVGVGFCTADEINKKGLTWANVQCMTRACHQVLENTKVDYYVFDQCPRCDFKPQMMMPKADGTSASVAAASIVAKVNRDKAIKELAVLYPEYEFEKHNGYINDLHVEKVKKYGFIPDFYRINYCVKSLQGKQVSIFNVKKS